MRVLYVAAGIPVPGTVGGSTHVIEVSRGLAALGHEVLVVAGPRGAAPPGPPDSVGERPRSGRGIQAYPDRAQTGDRPISPPGSGGPGGAAPEPGWSLPPSIGGAGEGTTLPVVNLAVPKQFSLLLYPALARLAGSFRPDVVMERYYNFAGAGLLYARRRGLPAVLEVNAPLYDPPGTTKDRLDRALGRPLRRWAGWQARAAARVVTPLATTLGRLAPPDAARRIVELPWGANTDLFDPARFDPAATAATRADLGIPPDAKVVAFSGSFRPWHGVATLLAAVRELLPRRPELWALLLGEGPERPALEEAVSGWGDAGRRVVFAGRVAYPEVPRYLAAADLGAAPFEPSRHPALRHFGFYWSPLKVFEYGAMALPAVCPAIAPLDTIVREGREGRLYPPGDRAGLVAALASLLDDAAGRRAMGASARERVATRYSWAAHCRALDEMLQTLPCLTSPVR